MFTIRSRFISGRTFTLCLSVSLPLSSVACVSDRFTCQSRLASRTDWASSHTVLIWCPTEHQLHFLTVLECCLLRRTFYSSGLYFFLRIRARDICIELLDSDIVTIVTVFLNPTGYIWYRLMALRPLVIILYYTVHAMGLGPLVICENFIGWGLQCEGPGASFGHVYAEGLVPLMVGLHCMCWWPGAPSHQPYTVYAEGSEAPSDQPKLEVLRVSGAPTGKLVCSITLYVLRACSYSNSNQLMALFHCMVRHGTVRYGSLLGGFPLGTVPGTWYFFSTTSVEVPSEPYRYQNVTCKLCWSLIGRRKSSLLRHWTCDTRPSSTALPARFKSAQPAKDRTQLLFKQTHIFASTTK